MGGGVLQDGDPGYAQEYWVCPVNEDHMSEDDESPRVPRLPPVVGDGALMRRF